MSLVSTISAHSATGRWLASDVAQAKIFCESAIFIFFFKHCVGTECTIELQCGAFLGYSISTSVGDSVTLSISAKKTEYL